MPHQHHHSVMASSADLNFAKNRQKPKKSKFGKNPKNHQKEEKGSHGELKIRGSDLRNADNGSEINIAKSTKKSKIGGKGRASHAPRWNDPRKRKRRTPKDRKSQAERLMRGGSQKSGL